MQKIAIIDIGSNSARLVITQIYKSGAYNMVYNQKEALRLSQKVDKKGNLTDVAFTDTIECMQSFASMCTLFATTRIIAVATAAIRNAKNGKQLVAEVKNATGIKLEIITGKTEAYMSFLGVINTLDIKDAVVFDLGGGSTELILVKNHKMVNSISLPIGCVNVTAEFNTRNKMSTATYKEMHKSIVSHMSKIAWLKNVKLPLIGVGGTARTLGKIDQKQERYFTSKIHNYQFTTQRFKTTFKYLKTTSFAERKSIPGLTSERSDIILAGAEIVNSLMDYTHSSKVIVSGCGLREGLFLNLYHTQRKQPLISKDILLESTTNALKLYTADPKHSLHVTDLALTMFDSWEKLHKLGEEWRKLLKTASLLHDIGITINYYSHARHSAYMIENAKIFGLSHKEQVMAAIIAGWHNGISRSYFKNRQFKNLLSPTDIKKISRLALLLALAESLDYSQTSQVKNVTATLSKKGATLVLTSSKLPSIELHQLKQLLPWFEKAFAMELTIKSNKE